MSTKLDLQKRKEFTTEIIQERNGGNNSVSFIKNHLSLPYPFKMNIQVWVHLAEHEFYKKQSRQRHKRVLLLTQAVQLNSLQDTGPGECDEWFN